MVNSQPASSRARADQALPGGPGEPRELPPGRCGLSEPLPGWRSSDCAGPQRHLTPTSKRTCLLGVRAIDEHAAVPPAGGSEPQPEPSLGPGG